MNKLIIEPTEDSPGIILDAENNKYEFSGESRPENAAKFYAPINKWFEEFDALLYFYKDNGTNISPMVFKFRFEYFNSTSAKYIMDILKKIEKLYDQDYPLEIEWHHDSFDEDMLDAGKEFGKLVKVPLNFISL
jgi:hypothetical protein